MNKVLLALLFTCISMAPAACMTLQAYSGESREMTSLAVVKGDFRVRAGAPVNVFLRQIDAQIVNWRYSAVAVLPGTHTLLVDCVVTESKNITRYVVTTELGAGTAYRVVATLAPGNQACDTVAVEVL